MIFKEIIKKITEVMLEKLKKKKNRHLYLEKLRICE